METGDSVTIPYPITSLRDILPILHGGEHGTYMRCVPNGLGETMYEIEINGIIYPLRKEEFDVVEL